MFCIVFIMVNYKPSFWRHIKAFKILGSAPQHCLFAFLILSYQGGFLFMLLIFYVYNQN